jgi:SAM-dependent methyltransferase
MPLRPLVHPLACVILGIAALVPAAAHAQQPILGSGGVVLDVPFGPTGATIVDTMLRVANVGPRDYVIDLGSGDGRINIAAARDRGAPGLGLDLDPALVRDATGLARIAGVADKVRFAVGDLFTADLSKATVVTLYLGPNVTPRVQPKLLAELAPGTRIVSNNFRMGDWQPDLVVQLRSNASTVYFWQVPARVAGLWRGTLKNEDGASLDYRFDLRQTYQEVEGEVALAGVRVFARDILVEGTRLRFLLQEQRGTSQFTFRRFVGEVQGDTIEGHFVREQPPAMLPFRMTRTVRAEPGPPGAWSFTPPRR